MQQVGLQAPRVALPVQNVGLVAGAAVPPLGVGVAPILGYPGPVPASVPASSIGANGAPGSISPYGGQWVLPLPVAPGQKIGNVSCDVITNASTIATVELVGRAVIGTVQAGPGNGVLARSWIVPTDTNPAGYTVEDGGPVVLRLSFRDSITGAWTSGVQQMPVLSCAVNAVNTLPLAAMAFLAEDPVHYPIDYIFGSAEGASFATRASLSVPVGHQIASVRVTIKDNALDPNAKLNLQLISINNNGSNVIASSAVSKGDGTLQLLSIAPSTIVAPHTAYYVHVYALGVPSAQDELWFGEVDYN